MDNLKFHTIKNCRICNSDKLESILNLGELYLSNFLSKDNALKQFSAPLELVQCRGECKLIQLRHTVSAQEMFIEYWYLSGINHSMTMELSHIVKSIESLIELNKDDFVIDIGANDGTLLRHYKNKKIIPDFFTFESWEKSSPNKTAKVITAIGMFYDLDDPNKFVEDIEKMLSNDGLFIIQMMYLPLFIEKNAFDGICHEHLEYYSLFSLEYLLSKFNLQVIGLEIREKINEGSARFYVVKKSFSKKINIKTEFKMNLNLYRDKEFKLKLDEINIYNKLKLNIENAKDKTMSFLNLERKKGKVIHGYAASTKGNTTLQYYGITSEIMEAISDKNPEKWGKYTSGTNIPVISEEESRHRNPDYYFVLAWHFIETFAEREKKFLEKGGKFIVSMPSFRVIDKNTYRETEFLKKIELKKINKVSFYKNDIFNNIDDRRKISGVVGDFGEILEIKQIKIIEFDQKAVNDKKIIGNHSHYASSNQWEIIVVIGDNKKPQINFRYRNKKQGEIQKKLLLGGTVVIIPPGCSLGLIPLNNSVKLIEISNKIYNESNYIADELF